MNTYITLKNLPKTLCGRSIFVGEALCLDWTLSGFSCTLSADIAVLHFGELPSTIQPIYIEVTLDGVTTKHAMIGAGQKIVLHLADAFSQDVHILRVRRLSEGDQPLLIEGITLYGENAVVLAPPSAPALRIEYIGDSITCGYGNLGDSDTHEFLTWQEDPTRTYAGLSAKLLGADIRIAAISGQGIVRNCRGELGTPIPDFFHWASSHYREEVDFAAWQPHVVVINAGTNDNGGQVSDEDFGEYADRFLTAVRSAYPDAQIIWAYGMMGLRYDAVLSALIEKRRETDDKITYLPIAPVRHEDGEIGVGGHPNVKGHTRAAKILAKEIKKLLKN